MENSLFTFNWLNLLLIPGLLIGYTIHELGHIFMAHFLGDQSQVEHEKITLNPLPHISWLGSFTFILFGLGWPKIMQVNPNNLKNRHWDMFLISIAGPLASFALCLTSAAITGIVILTLTIGSDANFNEVVGLIFPINPENFPEAFNIQALGIAFTSYLVQANLLLTIMSLLPLPAQDGFIALLSLIALFRERSNEASEQPVDDAPRLAPHQPMFPLQPRQKQTAIIHFNIGTEYHAEEKFDDAVARYRQAIANDQNFGAAYINMGLAYLGQNESTKALHAFRGALQYADDEMSRVEAIRQVAHLEAEFAEQEAKLDDNYGDNRVIPETKLQPDWRSFILSSSGLLLGGVLIYSYLITQLIEMLQSAG